MSPFVPRIFVSKEQNSRLGGACKHDQVLSCTPSTNKTAPTAPTAPASPPRLTGSLHDQLRCRDPSPSTKAMEIPQIMPEIRTSRPCYRCISHMNAVGIKRVFWTTADSIWEGAKVRKLVEALEVGEDDSSGESGGEKPSLGAFVTKHEVLRLRRFMGW